jgi:hypothetical protein
MSSRRAQKFERRAAVKQGAQALRSVLLRQAAEAGRSYTPHGIDCAVKDILRQYEQDEQFWRDLRARRLPLGE